ncbi:MAG: lactate dehydrogenase [Rubritepida sp.]|nr:lactate dehydrogenase [Rubritepida sp.]
MHDQTSVMPTITISDSDLTELLRRAFQRCGMDEHNAGILGPIVAAAERDGARSHGLLRMAGYEATLRSGWASGIARPVATHAAPTIVVVDGQNGFAQVALAAARSLALETVDELGMAAICIRNAHHFAALWPDLEPFAERGLVALTVVNSRSRLVLWGGKNKVLGTNPMAFACPRADGPPIIWDQAASVRAQGEVLLARKAGKPVAEGIGLDADGNPTTDPAAILDGGALLPFGGHKGAGIAFMIEVLAAAMSGGHLGFEEHRSEAPNGRSFNGGQFLLLIDPSRSAGPNFPMRTSTLVSALREAGATRLPSDERLHRRAISIRQGIEILESDYRHLLAMAEGTAIRS